MFALAAASLAVIAATAPDIARNNATLELDVRVVEAFERGPVIIEVSVTNRGTEPLCVEELTQDGFCWIDTPASWRLRDRKMRLCHVIAGFCRPLRPGETYTERHAFHTEYRSRFPAGTHQLEVFWRLRVWHEEHSRPGRVAALPSKAFPVTISPATPANRWAFVARLEAEFAALPPPSPDDAGFRSPFRTFCETVVFAPHPELVPLLLRALDRAAAGADDTRPALTPLSRDLVETMLDADPALAHRILVDRLLADPPRIDPRFVFRVWRAAEAEPVIVGMTYLDRFSDARFWCNPGLREHLAPWTPAIEYARWAKESAHRVLPDAELRRLATAKDRQVRELVEQTFGGRLKR